MSADYCRDLALGIISTTTDNIIDFHSHVTDELLGGPLQEKPRSPGELSPLRKA